MSSPPSAPPGSSDLPARADDVRIAAFGIALFAGCRAIEIFLEAQSMASAVAQAVLVEWGGSRVGVVWSPPGSAMTVPAVVRRAALGAVVGLSAAGVLFGVLLASRGASIAGVARGEASVLAVGFVTAGLAAWRDELLLHGLTFRALEGSAAGAPAKVVACGVTSAGAALGRADATAQTVFAAAALGLLFGALWARDRGAWQPWAASAAFRFTTATLLSGGLIHTRLANGWGGGAAGMLGGTAAAVALAPVAIFALAWTARARTGSPRSALVG